MEFVWVVPRSVLFPEATPNGFLALEPEMLEQQVLGPARDDGFFIERRYAETHPEFKQPIPYVAICQDDKVLCLTRLAKQGEARLHGKKSIGVGGHINPCDQNDGDIFANACQRELHEELILPSDAKLPLTPVGIINDDTTAVGAVHLGLVYSLDASLLDVSIRETDSMAGDFKSLADLRSLASTPESPFETWSSFLLMSEVLELQTT
ncbi:MAG: phosphoesterase [Planctomycetota bacterium]|jgi:predicted NUDIX family phosphoesterase|nr:phosphoesterase [Planctomycetota bacterium]